MIRLVKIILEYLVAFLLIGSLLLAIAGVIVVKYYGADLQNFVVDEVNSRLDSKIYVEEADVKVFHKFPNTSILLKGVTVWSSHNFNTLEFENEGADTLLTAETVSVSFNLFGLIRKKYNIRQLDISNGSLHLFTDSSGEGNYKISSDKNKDNKGAGQLDLSQVKISNYRILLDNRAKQLKSSGFLEQLELNGKFTKQKTQIKGSLEGRVEEISNKGILYASQRDIQTRINMTRSDSAYTIKAGQLQIDRIVADMDGSFWSSPGLGIQLDLYASARNLNIHEVLDLLPSELSTPLREIRGNGILQLDARITGMANSTLTPRIEANFQTSNANLSWDRLPFSLKQLDLTGTYSNGGEFNPTTTSLHIKSISTAIGDDQISGSGHISNFFDPDFSFQIRGDIHPRQWIKWYDQIPLDDADGILHSDLEVKGTYDRLKPKGEKFIAFDISGGLDIDQVSIHLRDRKIPFSELNGSVQIENDFWEPSLQGVYGKSDFTVRGSGVNLLSFLVDREESLVASATFRSNYFDLGALLQDLLGKGTKKGSERQRGIRFPDRLMVHLDFVINELQKDRLQASNVRGVAQYDSPFFHIDSLSMQTMDGNLHGSFGMAQDMNKEIFTQVSSSLYNIDISQLFFTFNNFGQTQLTHEHIKGSITGTSAFSANFDSLFSIKTESILSENDVTIRNGELNEFSPILALSRFIEVEELKNIQFQTLENTILIKENQVIIPVMDIQSNALNLSASGTHGFNNHYDYRVRLLLSDLLYNKARGAAQSEFEEAADESDNRMLFLKIQNQGDGSRVEMDREKTAEKIRQDLKEEKTELKSILNRELGLFRKDEEVKQQQNQQEDKEEIFKFEFQEDPDSISAQEPKRKTKRFFRRLNKTDSTETKPVQQFVIDENP